MCHCCIKNTQGPNIITLIMLNIHSVRKSKHQKCQPTKLVLQTLILLKICIYFEINCISKETKKTFFSSFKFSKGIFLNLQKKLDSATRDKQESLSYIFQKETFVKGESSSNTFVSLVNSERLEETSLLELEQAAAASCERQIIDIFFSTL